MTNVNKVNNHITDGVLAKIGKTRAVRWAELKPELQEQLLKTVSPTQKDAKVICVQPPSSVLATVRKGTKRDQLLLMGLKGAYHEDFNKAELSSIGFWKGAWDDVGLGYVIEEHPTTDGSKKSRLFCYYTFPEGVNALLYKDVKEKVEKKVPAEKAVKTEPKSVEKVIPTPVVKVAKKV